MALGKPAGEKVTRKSRPSGDVEPFQNLISFEFLTLYVTTYANQTLWLSKPVCTG